MNLIKKNLYFFFPYRGVGGVPILFLRLANYLSILDLYNIYLIDYEDGYMAKNYDKSKDIQFEKYQIDKNIYFKENDTVVFQSMPLWAMPPSLIFNDKTKLIYWNLYPYNMFGCASSIDKYFKNKVIRKLVTLCFRYFIYGDDRKAIKRFDEDKSIFFMDGENFEQTQEWLDVKLQNQLYLPLIIDNIENIKTGYMPKNNELKCLWIGRIGDFKVHILLYTLKKLNSLSKLISKKIFFSVVGTGEYLNYLKQEAEALENIQINYIDYIDPNDLKEYLNDIDIGFAMGTAALDFAKYGLPTVLLDFTYEELTQDYKFDWLYNTKNFTLGREITEELCEKNNRSLGNILGDVVVNYESISNKSFDYINNNFNIAKNVEKFIALVENSSLTYGHLNKKYFKMNIFHKLIGTKKYYND